MYSPAEFAAWMSIVKDVTVTGLLLFVLWGGSRRVWIWGHHYLEALARITHMEQEIDWWQERYLALTDTTSRAVGLAERRRKP